ncbi:Chaperone protein dnaJ 49 [Apostasia shenzhenica]|uniref:Chaperone protein dnaJ 49 n=1 Tax=Apostasia shenzhenica TaxID=1088818 RepID=A0A2I0AUX8_9ASPA|nr:Chaperone protein dnaJ 49 [Apostasia shenzhenica]
MNVYYAAEVTFLHFIEMDCNKEEAIRATEIAEKKMQNKDFLGAKRLLIRALHLYSEVQNASQMLTVCEVHCSAGSLIAGEQDYYGVLQIDWTADENLVKKQYRKLALLLHPDKNQFAGAEAAFKLVGEAYTILSDQTKRRIYDVKRKAKHMTALSKPASENSVDPWKYTCYSVNDTRKQFAGLQQKNQQQSSQTFWTMCTNCNYRFQYLQQLLNKEVVCQKCFKKFRAFDQQNVPVQNSHNLGGQTASNSSLKPEIIKENRDGGSGMDNLAGKKVKSENVKLHKANKKGHAVRTSSVKASRKRKSTGSDINDSDSSYSDFPRDPTTLNSELPGSRYPRRSTSGMENVTYKEDESEEDDSGLDDSVTSLSSRKVKMANDVKKKDNKSSLSEREIKVQQKVGSSNEDSMQSRNRPIEREIITEKKEVNFQKNKEHVGTNSNSICIDSRPRTSEVVCFSFPDPQFYEFDMNRDPSKFAVNQIWAVYDNVWDAMPRFYALILKVFSPKFKLQYAWLEYKPMTATERSWANAKLPVSCGNFKLGKRGIAEDQMMFSHLVYSEKGRRNSYTISPKKGEVWALFKDWDVSWNSAGGPKDYDYEFVEVLSNLEFGNDISVYYLVKVKGYMYLFARALDSGIITVPSGDLLKFSHCIPNYRVCGEKEGIPSASFELDPAALPAKFEKTSRSVSPETIKDLYTKSGEANLSDSAAQEKPSKLSLNTVLTEYDHLTKDDYNVDLIARKEQDSFNLKAESKDENVECPCSDPPSFIPADQEFADSDFYNFQEVKSKDKFKRGQIWALYSEKDGYPNYYALVENADLVETGILHVKWLEYCPFREEETVWFGKGLPVGCGRFQVTEETEDFDSTESFSHLVLPKLVSENKYEIYPSSGEIWAIFKNWNHNWTSSDMNEAVKYNIVEIIQRDSSVVKVWLLIKVNGYKCLFKPKTTRDAKIQIPMHECLKFSHQIPAFRLTDQEHEGLRDYWELDPSSIPQS